MKKFVSIAAGAVMALTSLAAASAPASAAGMMMGHPPMHPMGQPMMHMDHSRMDSSIEAWCSQRWHWNDSDCIEWRHGNPHWSDSRYQQWFYRHRGEHGFDPGLAAFFGIAGLAAGAAAANASHH